MSLVRRYSTAFLAVVAFSASGCGAGALESRVVDPEIEIEATETNQAIVEVMEAYREHLAELNLEGVGRLVSRDYYENGGTTDTTTDDYGYDGLMTMLQTLKDHVQEMRVEIMIRSITVERGRADVLYEYAYTMLYKLGEDAHWQTQRDVNRVQLQKEGDRWMIIGGL